MWPFKKKTMWQNIKLRIRRVPIALMLIACAGYFMFQVVIDMIVAIVAIIIVKIVLFSRR